MSYVEAQKVHDLKGLQHGNGSGPIEALRTVLAITLDYETAAWCLGCRVGQPVTRWPSTLYLILARSALGSPPVWRRCALVLDRTLHEAVRQYEEHPPAELAKLFVEGRESLSGEELAAILWCLVRRRSASHDLVAERLRIELAVIASRRLREPLVS